MRRFLAALCTAALAVFCPGGCACAPDRWTVGIKADRDPRTGECSQQEINASLSGPIPHTIHE